MVYFTLQLTSNESANFEYSFPQEFLDKKYEIGLLKLDGNLEINYKININQTNNKFFTQLMELIKIIIKFMKKILQIFQEVNMILMN